MILTDRTAAIKSGEAQEEFKRNPDIRLSPESIAAVWKLTQRCIDHKLICGTVIPLLGDPGQVRLDLGA